MIRPAVTATAMLLFLSGALAAQERELRLTLTEARGSFCISYLIDPAVAVGLAPEGAALSPAGKGTGLSPFLVRVIHDEPQFADWIPAAICLDRFVAAALDGKEVARAKGDKTINVTTAWISVEKPLGVEGATSALLELDIDEARVIRPLVEFGVLGGDRGIEVLPAERGDTEIRVKLAKTQIAWVGHPTGEARVGSTQTMSFGYTGMRNSTWLITRSVAPAETKLMVGALRVEGKDALAKALKSSPIRAVGPMDSGGTAEFLFHRLPSR